MSRIASSLLGLLGPLVFISLALCTAGLALGVAIFFYGELAAHLSGFSAWLYYPCQGIALALSYFVFGLALIMIAPIVTFLLGGRLKPYNGPAVSLSALRWYVHCTMTLLVRFCFLEFVTPSPIGLFFYRLMGMKIGRNVTINSTALADPSLLSIEDGATIGGSASVIGHYAQGGKLVLAPVMIRSGATIGLRAIVMGGSEVGERATLLANSFLLPRSKIPAGEIWAGIPAQKVTLPKREKNGGDL